MLWSTQSVFFIWCPLLPLLLLLLLFIIIHYYWYYYCKFFYTSISWWSFIGVEMTASPIRSLGFFLVSFTHQREQMASHRSPSDCKFPQISRTLLNILADLNNCSLDGLDSSSDFWFLRSLFQDFGDRSKLAKFHRFLCSLAMFKYLPFFSLPLIFTLWFVGTARSTKRQAQFCFL